jgi:uncharacterized membrane protein YphA (DoxX/SURF4 family)
MTDTMPAGEARAVLSYATQAQRASARTLAAEIVGHLCAIAVAGVFLYAASSKIWEPRQFVYAIDNYKMAPTWVLNLMAMILPWWEVGGAVALIVPRTRRAGALIISGLLLMFITAVSYAALYKGLNINCGCFGKDNPSQAGWKTIGLDAALYVATFLSVHFCPTPKRMTAANGLDAALAQASPAA